MTDIAVLIPCHNEAAAIASVVRGFREHLPAAEVYIYDNNSTDQTAVTATWYINRRLAFAASASANKMHEWGRYFAASMVGSGVNLAVYSICIYLSDFMFRMPVMALAIASVIALVVNYLGVKRHAFNA